MKYLSMTPQLNEYVTDNNAIEDKFLNDLRVRTILATGKGMMISPDQAQIMRVIIHSIRAKSILEVGVFTGYSSIVIAEAMPDDGTLECIDVNEEWTDIARENWKERKLLDKISLTLGDACLVMGEFVKQGRLYDLVFIDADKVSYDSYYEYGLKLLNPGGMMIMDNMLWKGTVSDIDCIDENVQSLRRINKKIYEDDRVVSTLLPIGDGMSVVCKL